MQAGKHQSPAYPAIASTAPKNHSIEVTKALASAWSYRQQNEQIPHERGVVTITPFSKHPVYNEFTPSDSIQKH